MALSLLLALGLFSWLVVVPVWQTCRAVERYHEHTPGAFRTISIDWEDEGGRTEEEVRRLGGPRSAGRCLALYLRLPARFALHPGAAAWMLSHCGEQARPAVPELLTLLKHSDRDVRTAAAFALGEARDRRAVEPLIAALADRQNNDRWVLVYALAKIGDTRAVEPFIADLKTDDPKAATAAIGALVRMKDPRSVPLLIALMRDKQQYEANRAAAAFALGVISDARAVSPLIAELDDSPLVLGHAIVTALGELGDPRALPALIAELKKPSRRLSSVAAGALGQIGDRRAVPALISSLRDAHSGDSAVCALGEIGDPRAAGPLISLLRDEMSVAYAARSLGQIGKRSPEATVLLIQLLRDGHDGTRHWATWALGQIGDDRAIEPLEKLLSSEDPGDRSSAAGALKKIRAAQEKGKSD